MGLGLSSTYGVQLAPNVSMTVTLVATDEVLVMYGRLVNPLAVQVAVARNTIITMITAACLHA